MSPRNLLLVSAFLLAVSTVLLAQAPSSPSSNPAAAAASQPKPTVDDVQAKLDRGQVDEAIAELLKLKAQDPNADGLARALGVASFRRGDFATTAAELKNV